MNTRSKPELRLYLVLSAFFICTLIVCNLIANKFVSIDLGFKTFVISAGVLPYPITFLITDILSEIYGRRQTNEIVLTGFGVSFFVLGILWLGNQFPAIAASPVSDEVYQTIFQNSWRVIIASMTAYLCAQLIDIRLFHFWKKKTNGRHLWLRNNASTITSQLLDTTLVVLVLFVGVLPGSTLINMIIDGWLFKSLCALIDTGPAYVIIHNIKAKFGLDHNQEITL